MTKKEDILDVTIRRALDAQRYLYNCPDAERALEAAQDICNHSSFDRQEMESLVGKAASNHVRKTQTNPGESGILDPDEHLACCLAADALRAALNAEDLFGWTRTVSRFSTATTKPEPAKHLQPPHRHKWTKKSELIEVCSLCSKEREKLPKGHQHKWTASPTSELIQVCACGEKREALTSRVFRYGLGAPIYGSEECLLCAGKSAQYHELVDSYAEERATLQVELDEINEQLREAEGVVRDTCHAELDDLTVQLEEARKKAQAPFQAKLDAVNEKLKQLKKGESRTALQAESRALKKQLKKAGGKECVVLQGKLRVLNDNLKKKLKGIEAKKKPIEDRFTEIQRILDEPLCSGHRFRHQVWLGHKHRDALALVFRDAAREYRKILGPYAEELDALQADLDTLDEQLKSARALVKADKTNQAAKKLVKDLSTQRKPLYARMKEIRDAINKDPEMQPLLQASKQECRRQVKLARERFRVLGIMWGTYGKNEDAANQAQFAEGRKGEVARKRWEGSGRVAVQLQQGLLIENMWGKDTRLQIDPVPEDTWTRRRADGTIDRQYRRQNCRTRVRLRIGSDAKRKPIWVEFPIALHRMPPSNGAIKWAQVVQERVGTHYKYSLHLTVEMPKEAPVKRTGVVGVNLGWRRLGDRLRVAYWQGDDGEYGTLFLPKRCLEDTETVTKLQKQRDDMMNAIKADFAEWLRSNKDNLPQWLKDHRGIWFVHEWRSTARLAGLTHRWRHNRFKDDVKMYDALEAWRYEDKKLYDRQSFLRRKIALLRQSTYRNFAADLATRYGTVIVDGTDYRRFGRKKAPEEADTGDSNALRAQSKLASPGMLRGDIANACSTRRSNLEKVDAAYITKTCHVCSEINDWDQALSVTHWCSSCGAFWDQDHNAAINLCRVGGGDVPNFERPNDPKNTESARSVKSLQNTAPAAL